jgi:hypothetical protein
VPTTVAPTFVAAGIFGVFTSSADKTVLSVEGDRG